MLAPCVQEWWNQPLHHWNHRILEFLLLDSSGHGLQDACTVPTCSCRGEAPINHKLCSLGRAAQALPRCQSWRQEVTRSVGPPQKILQESKRKTCRCVPMKEQQCAGTAHCNSPPKLPVLWISPKSQHEMTQLSKIPK